jgi:hypothetical protein
MVDLTVVAKEERLVAELELLGVRYLSRQTLYQTGAVRPPAELLAALVCQPSARVRASVIAVLLAHPEFSEAALLALRRLGSFEQLKVKLFYTAAVFLQQIFADRLRPFLAGRWLALPDYFSGELGLMPGRTPQERLVELGRVHASLTNTAVNWTGTYTNVAEKLLRRWEAERLWNQ